LISGVFADVVVPFISTHHTTHHHTVHQLFVDQTLVDHALVLIEVVLLELDDHALLLVVEFEMLEFEDVVEGHHPEEPHQLVVDQAVVLLVVLEVVDPHILLQFELIYCHQGFAIQAHSEHVYLMILSLDCSHDIFTISSNFSPYFSLSSFSNTSLSSPCSSLSLEKISRVCGSSSTDCVKNETGPLFIAHH
jgi:hypothetical protein